MNILLFIGPPGSGKGTQAILIHQELDIPHISTGDILRDAVKENSELGKKAKKYMDAGDLVPDDIMIGIIRERILKEDCRNGYILDGFPRTTLQGEALEKMLDDNNQSITRVFYIDVEDEVLVKRILGRQTCPQCGAVFNKYFQPPQEEGICDNCEFKLITRTDDNEQSIQNRLKKYKANTLPLINHFKEKDLLVNIDGSQTIEDAKNQILSYLER